MEDRKGNIILSIVSGILMIIAIVIVIINPNKIEKTPDAKQNVQEEVNVEKQPSTAEKINKQEEKEQSMQVGGAFCKVDDNIVFYEDTNKTIYKCNLTENKINKLTTVSHTINKMYFDGENIYYIPSYYSDKGIYKVDLQGNTQKISEETSLQLWITDDKIYFVKQIGYDDFNHNPQGTICNMDKNGENVKEIAQNIKNYFYIENDKIHYTTQDRKMYSINQDGTGQEEIVQGRKFVIATGEKYLLYIDYANQEAKHIYNIETKEDSIIGYFGTVLNYQGKTYLNARKRLDDGALDTEYTLFEIKENSSVKEIGKIANLGTDIKYILDGKAYIYNQQEGTNIINLENNQKESAENYNNCRYFLGGYGYKIDTSNIEDIKIEKIEL